MSRVYLDSSVLLNFVLGYENLEIIVDKASTLFTCEITELECRRTMDRIRIQANISDAEIAARLDGLSKLLRGFRVIRIDKFLLKRAKAPFPTTVRSLDAIHLAAAELAQVTLFITRDKQQLVAAKALGLNT